MKDAELIASVSSREDITSCVRYIYLFSLDCSTSRCPELPWGRQKASSGVMDSHQHNTTQGVPSHHLLGNFRALPHPEMKPATAHFTHINRTVLHVYLTNREAGPVENLRGAPGSGASKRKNGAEYESSGSRCAGGIVGNARDIS